MDRLIVKGLGLADGEYDLDLVALANIGTPASLTTREQHKVKLDAGVLPADLVQAVRGLDAAVMVSLASIVIARAGKRVNDELLWDARFLYGFGQEIPDLDVEKHVVAFIVADREQEEDEDDDGPPASASESSPSGGGSTPPSSESQENDPSHTGHPGSLTSSVSDQETSAS